MNESLEALRAARSEAQRRALALILAAALALLLLSLYFTFSAGAVIRIQPADAAAQADIRLSRGLGLIYQDSVFSLGSKIELDVAAEGFAPRTVPVDLGAVAGVIRIEMQELPAQLSITTRPASSETRLYLNGKLLIAEPTYQGEISAGDYELSIKNPSMHTQIQPLLLKRGAVLELDIELPIHTARVSLRMTPLDAAILVDGILLENSVQSFELAAGRHPLEISHEDYVTQLDEVVITRSIDNLALDYQLHLKPGVLKVTLQPETALLIVDGREVRGAYNEIAVAAGSTVQLVATSPGYTRYTGSVSLATQEEKEVSITLLEQRGKIEVTATPQGEVRVDGKSMGQTPINLDLLAVNQRIEVRKSGYRTFSRNITPQTGKKRSIHASLVTEKEARIAEAKPVMANSLGMQLRLFAPAKLELGSAHREPGQSANEIFRQVEITRHFYLAEQLVTAGQFAQFKPSAGLSGKKPAVQVSWVSAAGFCNWLSAKEHLSPVYKISGGNLVGVDSLADGYRLPTEAEWAWVARYGRYAQPPRYSWGNNLPVPKGAGNFADETAKARVSVYIPQYKDGYPELSPGGAFKANANGIYDIGGNAREWNHDFFELMPMRQPGLEMDRLGPVRGDGHVLRGSSWRTADISKIRLAARAQGSAGTDDVGFRVARWLGGY